MPVWVVVSEGHVSDDLDAGRISGNGEQGGETMIALDCMCHDDDHLGGRTEGHEPLLAVEHPLARRGAMRCRRDPRGVASGLGLRDGIGIVELTAQGGDEPTLDLLRARRLPDVIGIGHVPGDAVR